MLQSPASDKEVTPSRTLNRDYWLTPIQRVQKLVCEAFGVTRIDLISDRRDRAIMPARYICYWLCKRLTTASYPTIGHMFNHRHHTSIIVGAKKAEYMMQRDVTLKEKAEDIIEVWGNG